MSATSKAYKLSEEEFSKIIKESSSCAVAMRTMGYSCTTGNSHIAVKRRIAELNCSTEHFSRKGPGYQAKHALVDVLVENSTYANIASLKRRLIREEILEYKCAICGIN